MSKRLCRGAGKNPGAVAAEAVSPRAGEASCHHQREKMIAGDILGERAHITPDKLALVFVPTGERFTPELRERYLKEESASAAT